MIVTKSSIKGVPEFRPLDACCGTISGKRHKAPIADLGLNLEVTWYVGDQLTRRLIPPVWFLVEYLYIANQHCGGTVR